MKRKFTACLTSTLLTTAVMQAEDCCMPDYMPGQVICDGYAGYSQYAGVELDCGWDVYARGEFLYWRPFRGIGYVAAVIPQNTFTQPQQELGLKFGFRPGFSVGLGMIAHCFDDWMFNLDYTRYHQSFTKTYSETLPNTLQSTLDVFLFTFASSIKNKCHFHYDVVGLNMQRPNYLGQRVILSPFLGLKWLKRNASASQDIIEPSGAVNNATATLKYTSIGISAGFDGSWLMCWGLSLIGKADVALLYPYQRSFFQVVTPAVATPFNAVVTTRHHIRHLDIYGRGGVGLGWGSYLCCNRYHVNFSATYDFMGDVSKLDFLTGILVNGSNILMGLTVRGQFDF